MFSGGSLCFSLDEEVLDEVDQITDSFHGVINAVGVVSVVYMICFLFVNKKQRKMS